MGRVYELSGHRHVLQVVWQDYRRIPDPGSRIPACNEIILMI